MQETCLEQSLYILFFCKIHMLPHFWVRVSQQQRCAFACRLQVATKGPAYAANNRANNCIYWRQRGDGGHLQHRGHPVAFHLSLWGTEHRRDVSASPPGGSRGLRLQIYSHKSKYSNVKNPQPLPSRQQSQREKRDGGHRNHSRQTPSSRNFIDLRCFPNNFP